MMHYTDNLEDIRPEQLGGLFARWPNPPSPETHLRILRQGSHVVLAVEPGRVVGFVAAVSDGVLSADVSLLEVLPSHRGRGVGTGLVLRLRNRLAGLYSINLHCDPELQPFYEALAMQPLRGMAIRETVSITCTWRT